ncbi:MAG: Lhr family helicase [Acidobacteriota bacterium]
MTRRIGMMPDALDLFRNPVRQWFRATFQSPSRPQQLGWPHIARGESTLILAPTGTGKTLTAFLACLDRTMFEPVRAPAERCRVVYVSPLKALAFDVERNLRVPLDGIAAMADASGTPCHRPVVTLRTGDTPSAERARFRRQPGDILVTTPESLFLLLTSAARDRLRAVETVIIDEIHALVPTKRGAHLAVSLERLEHLVGRPLQRIGLSATQRPLDEVGRFLGGATIANDSVAYRRVSIVDTREPKRLDLRVEAPIANMADLGSAGVTSIWTAVHPRLLDLIRAHRSTLIFVNSRRLAERLASALNELADEPLVRAHHGSLARAQRLEVEELLKAGRLRGLVATSSLELGIDMGAIDLVVHMEAPPSVAGGLQRIGRAGHRIEDVSSGVIVPKHRGDLLACAAVTQAMLTGQVEISRYPRNPLDVLAQQIVAMVAMEPWKTHDLFDSVRGAAPFSDLGRSRFDDVLDMLSGRYPSDEFAELRPRVTWDRIAERVSAREGAKQVAIANAGTIPDRGMFGVFLLGADRERARVGELDAEMVFEARVGETFLLGASTWRIEQVTHDRVIVSPAPGEPGKMPFWRGERAGRPVELGRAIARLVGELHRLPVEAAVALLHGECALDRSAATNLWHYVDDQQRAVGAVPDDQTLLIERTRDEMGDWRVLLVSPLGSQVHAPWAMAVSARIRHLTDTDAHVVWGDDGFIVRWPDTGVAPEPGWMLPDPDEVEAQLLAELGATALFAARFREAAGRALLLPRRRPGMRAPFWQQRKRAAELLAVASRFRSFPIVLEAYRECLHDVFDVPALVDVLRRVRSRTLRVVMADTRVPSPFASSLLFNYVANYIYEGDAPLAERRAQALTVDPSQLAELIGDVDLGELLDGRDIEAMEADLQYVSERRRAHSADTVHDLLLRLGELSREQVQARSDPGLATRVVDALITEGRVVEVRIAGEPRLVAVEHAARYRDALGIALPPGVPQALLTPVVDPLGDVLKRYARTHGPFTISAVAERLGVAPARIEAAFDILAAHGSVVNGTFRPGSTTREWCDREVLARLRRQSLARLRREAEPVDGPVLGRFLCAWHGIGRDRGGLDALLDAIEQLQGLPLVASLLEREILPARIADYAPAHLDTLLAAGEVVWAGVDSIGEGDGRIALYLADHLPRLLPPPAAAGEARGPLAGRAPEVLERLAVHGASFFAPLHDAVGGGFPHETVQALWALVWQGLVTNDSMHVLRAYLRPPARERRPGRSAPFRTRRLVPPTADGRWSAVSATRDGTTTEWAASLAQQLLARHGIVTREVTAQDPVPGGFSTLYPVLKRMEEAGRARRGYFVAGLGAAQFALPGAVDLLRDSREDADPIVVHTLAATDPANPFGSALPWPEWSAPTVRASRSVGARVVLTNGRVSAWIARGDRTMLVSLPDDEADRSRHGDALARELVALAGRAPEGQRGWLIETINGGAAAQDPAAVFLLGAGFAATARGLQLRVPRRR